MEVGSLSDAEVDRPRRRRFGVFVFDTTAVTDTKLRELLEASSLDEAVAKLTDLLARARIAFEVEVYMPPSVLEETKRFLLSNDVRPETLQELLSWIKVKPPARHALSIPASVVHSYVDEVRRRMTKGLKVAEESVRRAYRLPPKQERPLGSDDLGTLIRELRVRYREAVRRGLLDSVEDLDAVLLALELGVVLVTSDEGARKFAESLGVTTMDPASFASMLANVREKLRKLALEEPW
jgi:hypothetical protein